MVSERWKYYFPAQEKSNELVIQRELIEVHVSDNLNL